MDPVARDIAVLCECKLEIRAEELLGQSAGFVVEPRFRLSHDTVIVPADFSDRNDLKGTLEFLEENFDFGLRCIAQYGTVA